MIFRDQRQDQPNYEPNDRHHDWPWLVSCPTILSPILIRSTWSTVLIASLLVKTTYQVLLQCCIPIENNTMFWFCWWYLRVPRHPWIYCICSNLFPGFNSSTFYCHKHLASVLKAVTNEIGDKKVNRSQSLFYFVPQEKDSQSSWLDYKKGKCWIFLVHCGLMVIRLLTRERMDRTLLI